MALFPRLELPRLELCFKDGTRVWLRACAHDPITRTFDHNGEVLTIDLRKLCPDLQSHVDGASSHDKPAVIFFTLRHKYPSLASFTDAVQAVQSTQEVAHG